MVTDCLPLYIQRMPLEKASYDVQGTALVCRQTDNSPSSNVWSLHAGDKTKQSEGAFFCLL